MTGKIVRTKLILRILSVREQILDPRFPQLHIFPGKGEIAVGDGTGRDQNEHIARFLHRHLPFFGIVRIDLSGKNRILPTVVRGKIKVPPLALGIPDDRPHHAAHQLRIVEQIQRRGRIAQIHCGGATVGKAFLGDK